MLQNDEIIISANLLVFIQPNLVLQQACGLNDKALYQYVSTLFSDQYLDCILSYYHKYYKLCLCAEEVNN